MAGRLEMREEVFFTLAASWLRISQLPMEQEKPKVQRLNSFAA
jgi:hypothetical protein